MKMCWSYLFALVPVLAEILEHGRFPEDPRQAIAAAASTLAILILAVWLCRKTNRLAALSERDPLTGLFNRRRFQQDLSQEVTRAERQEVPLTLACLDIDRFKSIIETHGRMESESVLIWLADVLETVVRVDVDRRYRLGGDEFCVLMPNLSEQEATAILDRIWTKTGEESSPLHRYDLGISMAVVSLLAGESAEAFLKRADKQMFDTKRARKKSADAQLSEDPPL